MKLIELSHDHQSNNLLSSSKLVVASKDSSQLGNTQCLCLTILPAQAEPGRGYKSLVFDFVVNLKYLSDDLHGLELGLKFETLATWPKFFSAVKSLNKQCGVWILLGLLKIMESRPVTGAFQPSSRSIKLAQSMQVQFSIWLYFHHFGCKFLAAIYSEQNLIRRPFLEQVVNHNLHRVPFGTCWS